MEFSCRIDALRASFTKSRRSAIGRCRPFGLPDWGPFGVVSNRSLAATRPSFSIVHFTASVEMLSTFGVETPIGNHASRRSRKDWRFRQVDIVVGDCARQQKVGDWVRDPMAAILL